jgi:drug/metabolite transporter (DMT)-like permease
MLSSGLALIASVLWGSSDFGAGILTRRTSLWALVLFSQFGGLAAAIILVVAHGRPAPGPAGVVISLLTGVLGFVAIISLYKALSIGVMSLVAPLAATGILVPIVVGFVRGDRPTLLQAAGMALALTGVLLASIEPTESPRELAVTEALAQGGCERLAGPQIAGPGIVSIAIQAECESGAGSLGASTGTTGVTARLKGALLSRVSIVLALIAAFSIGLSYVGLSEAARYDSYWCVLIMRFTSLPLVLITIAATRPKLNIKGSLVPAMMVVGACDVAANALFALASTGALLTIVSVLAYLFPVVTVLLAHIFLHERLTRLQQLGAGAALVGALLMVA